MASRSRPPLDRSSAGRTGRRARGHGPDRALVQLDLFPMDVHLRCVDPACNRRRFYALSVERTLFGEWVLVREWGRIGAGGRIRRDLFPSAGAALDALFDIRLQKARRGYAAV